MLSKDIVKEIKAVKGQDTIVNYVNSQFYTPNEFKDVVTKGVLLVCPHLAPILNAKPITNNIANAVMGKIDRS